MSDIIERCAAGLARAVGLNYAALGEHNATNANIDGVFVYGKQYWRAQAASALDSLLIPNARALSIAELRAYWGGCYEGTQEDPLA